MSSSRRVHVGYRGRCSMHACGVIFLAHGLAACSGGAKGSPLGSEPDGGPPSVSISDGGVSGAGGDASARPDGGSHTGDGGSHTGDAGGQGPDSGTTPLVDSGTVVPIGDGGPHATYVAADLPDYQWDALPAGSVPWGRISQLNLGDMWPIAANGGYTLGEDNWGGNTANPLSAPWQSKVTAYTAAGHAAGVKVVMLLGGAGGNPNPSGASGQDLFALATDTDQHANAFATNIKTVLQSMQLDGVDIDWEDGSASSAIMYAGLVRLAHQLRIVWPTGIIIIPAGAQGDDAVSLAPASSDVDGFEPMTYLDPPQWGGWVIPSPLTPLHDPMNNGYSIDTTLQKWTAAGVPASKVFLGAGGYGAVWGDTNGDHQAPNVPFANQAAVKTNGNALPNGEKGSVCSDNHVVQTWLSKTVAAYPSLQSHWDPSTETTYWGAPSPTSLVTVPSPCGSGTLDVGLILYESPQSIQAKAAYVKAHGMRGISFWTLEELGDTSSGGAEAWPVLEAIP